jgi:hypothetical protein
MTVKPRPRAARRGAAVDSARLRGPSAQDTARILRAGGISRMMQTEHDTMRKAIFFTACILLLAAASTAGAQSTLSLNQVTTLPQVDGVISPREYSLSTRMDSMELDLLWTTDTLYVAVSGQTSGWVAVGIGSTVMDGSVMYIGFVTGESMQLKVQEGVQHSHADIRPNAPLQYFMRESGGQTVLELALRSSDFITNGQKKLDLIIAMGGSDSFLSMHKAKAGFTVSLTH